MAESPSDPTGQGAPSQGNEGFPHTAQMSTSGALTGHQTHDVKDPEGTYILIRVRQGRAGESVPS